jgi:splicing factor 3A subunit 3
MTLLEQGRAMHAEVEAMEKMVAEELKQPTRTHSERLEQSHRAAQLLQHASERSAKLRKLYADDDGARREEVLLLGGGEEHSPFPTFYDFLKDVRDFHRRYPGLSADSGDALRELATSNSATDLFSAEEASGKRLDLHSIHLRFLNSNFGWKADYLSFLKTLPNELLDRVDRSRKLSAQYKSFLDDLANYVESFHARARPLTQMSLLRKRLQNDFDRSWNAGNVPGWTDCGSELVKPPEPDKVPIRLDMLHSVQDAEQIGAETLKDALKKMGIKCGGTQSERAERLLRVKDTPLDQVDKKLRAKGPSTPIADESLRQKREEHVRNVALLELKLRQLLSNELKAELDTTIGNAEKKQTMSYEELQEEAEEGDEAVDFGDEDEEEQQDVSSGKLPLGWDGKPIPYWLYKLHGLNVEYKCEICGNYSYWGRRAYERHFREWRHQHGLRCLGIQPSDAFLEVTSIDEALRLHKHLQEQQRKSFKPEDHEECEDSDGNVYNRKVYNDLKAQGLL